MTQSQAEHSIIQLSLRHASLEGHHSYREARLCEQLSTILGIHTPWTRTETRVKRKFNCLLPRGIGVQSYGTALTITVTVIVNNCHSIVCPENHYAVLLLSLLLFCELICDHRYYHHHRHYRRRHSFSYYQ